MADMSSFEAEGADFSEAPWNYIPAIMLLPEDPVKVSECLNALKARGLLRALAKLADDRDAPALGAGLAVWMAEYAGRWRALFEEATLPAKAGFDHGGPLAGLTLLIPLIISRKHSSKRPGRSAAYRVFAPRGKTAGASERTLQENWMK